MVICVYVTDSTAPKYLKRAELSKTGSLVHLTCEFADDYPKASCVLVYRKYNMTHLTVTEYDQSTEFPVTISVDNTEEYTFAVFGKNDTELEEVVFSSKYYQINLCDYSEHQSS